MAERRVTATGKGPEGRITKLCGEWGYADETVAIGQIESGVYRYYVQQPWTTPSDVVVASGADGKYLSTESGASPRNSLAALPDC